MCFLKEVTLPAGFGMSIDEDYEYAKGRHPDRLYVSKQFPSKSDDGAPARYAHRVFPTDQLVEVVKERSEVILRSTPGGLQQVKAMYLEDSQRIPLLWF